MSDGSMPASDDDKIDIYSFDAWVKAINQVRIHEKGYWAAILRLGSQGPLWQHAFEGNGEAEVNKVEHTYQQEWAEVKTAFTDVTVDDEEGHAQTLGDEVEMAVHFCTQIMMMPRSPFVNAMYTWMMAEAKRANLSGITSRNPLHPDYYRDQNGEPMHQYGIRAKLLEGLGQAVVESARKQGLKDASWGFDQCKKNAEGNAAPKYLIKHADGTFKDISADELQSLLAQENGPHIVMTANHAFLEDKNADLDSITKGVENLVIESVKHDQDANSKLAIKGYDENPAKGDTVMVAAIYSRENNILNLAHLFRRLDKIKQFKNDPKEDTLNDVSPASLMIASTVLKTILREPNNVASVDDEPAFLEVSELGRSQAPELLKSGEHIFHPDAAERLRHLVQVGFSQGGNVMRDALRYVVHEIDRVQVQAAEPDKNTQEAAREILSALSVTAISLNEVQMSNFYIDYGVNCARISNAYERRDLGGFIAVPDETPHRTSDPNIIFPAFQKSHGHHPKFMFDAITKKGENGEDARALSYFACGFAPNVGKVALRMVRCDGDNLLFELSGRSKEDNVNIARETLQNALKEAGLEDAQLKVDRRTNVGRRQFRLTPGEQYGEDKSGVLDKVCKALTASQEKLVVSDDVLKGIEIIKRSEAGFNVEKAVEAEHRLENLKSLDPYTRVNASQIAAVKDYLAGDPIRPSR